MKIRPLEFALLILLSLLSAACADDSPFVLSREEALKQIEEISASRDPFYAVRNVVAVINNDIYYFDRLDVLPRRLTSSPGQAKSNVKLSSDRTKIAYINANGNPVIIRASDGVVLETLTAYKFIKQMGWVRNSETLFMLIGQRVVLHGAAVEFTQPEVTHPWDEITSFSLNSSGDEAYVIRPYGSGTSWLVYRSNEENIDEIFSSFEGDRIDYVHFYDDKGNFLVGRKNYLGTGINQIKCIQNYDFYPAFVLEYEDMQTPTFSSDQEIVFFSTAENGRYYIKGIYLGTEAYGNRGSSDVLTRTLEAYESETPIWIDWAQ